jgi:hypothetical protein
MDLLEEHVFSNLPAISRGSAFVLRVIVYNCEFEGHNISQQAGHVITIN